MRTSIKFIHYTDVHLRETNPPSRLGDYRADILGKLRQILNLARDHKVDFTFCGGDLFDNKKPQATSHETVIELHNMYREVGIPHFVVPGNHDLTGDNMETLKQQPLGVLISSGILTQVEDNKVCKGDLSVSLKSFDFDENPDLILVTNPNAGPEFDVSILGIHLYASPRGGSLYGNTKVYSYQELATTLYDIYLLGHYHADNGVVTADYGAGKDQTFVNVGSVARGDYGDENLARTPKVCLVTITKEDGKVSWETEEICLQVRSNVETFDMERKVKVQEQKEKANTFVSQLQVATESVSVQDSIEENIANLAPEEDVREAVLELIDLAEEELALIKNNQKGTSRSRVKTSELAQLTEGVSLT
jgi:DNA repair protein SbcD/Mre11